MSAPDHAQQRARPQRPAAAQQLTLLLARRRRRGDGTFGDFARSAFECSPTTWRLAFCPNTRTANSNSSFVNLGTAGTTKLDYPPQFFLGLIDRPRNRKLNISNVRIRPLPHLTAPKLNRRFFLRGPRTPASLRKCRRLLIPTSRRRQALDGGENRFEFERLRQRIPASVLLLLTCDALILSFSRFFLLRSN